MLTAKAYSVSVQFDITPSSGAAAGCDQKLNKLETFKQRE